MKIIGGGRVENQKGCQTVLLFVYGTLKRGFRNHYLLHDARYLHDTHTRNAAYTMRVFNDPATQSPYPAVFHGGTHKIMGELYQVTPLTLARVDILEAIGQDYDRVTMDTQCGESAQGYISLETHMKCIGKFVQTNATLNLMSFTADCP